MGHVDIAAARGRGAGSGLVPGLRQRDVPPPISRSFPQWRSSCSSSRTSFFERYLAFFREVQRHGTWARLRAAQIELIDSVGEGFRLLVVLQGALSYLAILLAPAMFDALGLGFTQIAMFRFGVLGALFHALLLFVLIVFAYFDLRRLALKIVLFFLLVNGGISALTLWGGFAWYGYGYFLSAVATFSIAYAIMLRKIANLPYLVFVEINPSVRHD